MMSDLWGKLMADMVAGLSPSQFREGIYIAAIIVGGVFVYGATGNPPFDGFATQSDIQQLDLRIERMKNDELNPITTQLLKLQRTLLEKDLWDLQLQRCQAQENSLRVVLATRVDRRQSEYFELFRERYPLPPCSEL